MNNLRDNFTRAVIQSRLLTAIQKRELLDKPELLPEEYRERIVRILSTFDERSKHREYVLRKHLVHAYNKFEQTVATETIPEDEKKQLIAKVRKQEKNLFPVHTP